MHTARSASISSPIYQSFPPPARIERPTFKARRPSLTNTMSKFKESLRERIQDNVHSHRRAQSHDQSGSYRDDGDGPYGPKGIVISEPKLTGSADSLTSGRLGPLGSGAIIVSTPQEALSLSAANGGYHGAPASTSTPSRIHQYHKQQPESVREEADVISPPPSPPLPPLPASLPVSPVQSKSMQREWEQSRRSAGSSSSQSSGGAGYQSEPSGRLGGSRSVRSSPLAQPSQSLPRIKTHSLPHGQLSPMLEDEPVIPEARSQRVLRKPEPQLEPRRKSCSSLSRPGSDAACSSAAGPGSRVSESDCFAAAPQLPIDLASALPQPPFEPVLMSNLPANMHKTDPGKLIVVLETGTATLKSTLKTLTARPSYLASYLTDLVGSTNTSADPVAQTPRDELADGGDGASMYSQRSEFHDSDDDENYAGFNSLFQDHLASTGIMKSRQPKRRADATSVIHVFLDRPSEPYEHIIAYLRAPVSRSNPPGMLPYAARLFPAARHSFATARLEALLDLRDEAAYLGFDDLQQLCDDELAGQVPIVTIAAGGSAHRPNDAERISVQSTHTTHTLCDPSASSKEKETNSPQLHSVDIPVVLPTREPRSAAVNTQKTYSSESASSNISRRDRRAGQVELISPRSNGIVNASQLRQQSRDRDRTAPAKGNYF
ncbi:hypothetical protein DFH11DRAFT_683638 [Phellopilus nigrolimitatus]|nr:hypothetical protein DFH11DRAFT_683638 [Phellopilus nigrolimitatus]